MDVNKRARGEHAGQGIIEYAGAMVVAMAVVAVLTTGIQTNGWMYDSYNTLFNFAGNLLLTEVAQL